MSKAKYLELLSDFVFHIGNTLGFDNEESEKLLPRLEHSLSCLEVLHLPAHLHRLTPDKTITNAQFIRQMNVIEASIANHLYQEGNAREQFILYDKNHSGFLSAGEFSKCIETGAGIYLDDNELQYLLQKYDTNRNGMINYTDFIKIGQDQQNYLSESHTAHSSALISHMQHQGTSSSARCDDDDAEETRVRAHAVASMIRAKCYQRFKSTTDLFLHLDTEKNGSVSIDEFHDGLAHLGIEVSKSDLIDMTSYFISKGKNNEANDVLSMEDLAHFLENQSMFTFPDKAVDETRIQTNVSAIHHASQTPHATSSASRDFLSQSFPLHVKKEDVSNQTTNNLSSSVEKVTRDLSQMMRDSGKNLKEMFTIIDVDGSGEITPDNFINGLQKLGLKNLTKAVSDRVLSNYDASGSGTLGYSDFVKMMQQMYREDESLHHY